MLSFRRFGRLCAAALLAVSGFAAVPAAASYAAPAVREQADLGGGWRFVRADVPNAQAKDFDDTAWSVVTVPHTWNAADGQDGGGDYYRGTGWYRRHYTPPPEFVDKRLWLQFDGVNTTADVWVNGVHLGQHRGGYATFRFDATGTLVPGRDNVIAVKVSNAPDPAIAPLSADYTFFGGIYRNVSLQATDPLSVRMLDYGGPGVYLRQRSVDAASATVDVTTRTWNNSGRTRRVQVRAVIADATGHVVARNATAVAEVAAATGFDARQSVVIPEPHRWQGTADPYRYRATVEVLDADGGRVTDAVTQQLGLRSYRVDPVSGFFLNGQHVALHGVNAHQDRLDKGWAVGAGDHVRDFDLMDEMGVNALRTAHYQQAQQVYDLADQRGYLVWAEVPMVDKITDSDAFRANIRQQLYELIRQNYNHPSIVFWGIGNEQRTNDTATNAILDSLAGLVRSEDPGRLSTYATNQGDTDALANHTDVIGYNRYYGWYSGSATGLGPWADRLHAADPGREIGISEYGAGASVHQHEENPQRPAPAGPWHPEEYQSLLHEASWQQIAARRYLWGTFVWNMFDFAVDSRAEGDTPGRNDKGLVTYDRATRKDAFYWYRANWTAEPFVHLTSARWTQRTAATTTVKVYGTVDSASLTVNGVPVGPAKTPAAHIYTWPVTLSPGANHVVVTGVRAGKSYSDSATWVLKTP